MGSIIFVLSPRECAKCTEKYRKGKVWGKMGRTNECCFDVGGLVIVFHIIEGCHYRFFQRIFVVGNENIVKTLLLLKEGSAPMLSVCIVNSRLYNLAQLGILNIFVCDFHSAFFQDPSLHWFLQDFQ